jgi:hypothetical protein
MNPRPRHFALALAFCSALTFHAQTPTPQPAKRQPPKPAAEQAPGAAPDKVWLNDSTKVYHCPGDRYYGRTRQGHYVTEAQAKAAGAHGPRGESCFK